MALIDATCEKDLDEVRRLLFEGADVEVTNGVDWTALHWACDYGYDQIAQVLIDSGAKVDRYDGLGYNAMHWASDHGRTGCVEILLRGGAKPDLLDKVGKTALIYAIRDGNYEMAKVLIEHGANPYLGRYSAIQQIRDCGDMKMLKILLQGRIDLRYAVLLAIMCVQMKQETGSHVVFKMSKLCDALVRYVLEFI